MRISTGYKVNRRLVAFMTALVVLVVSTLPQSIRAYADTDINQDGVFFAGFEEIFEQQVSENDISGDTTSGNSISGNTVILLMNGGDLNDADKAAGLYTQSTTGDYTFVLQESLNPALPYPVKQDMIFDGWYLEPVEEKSTDTARTQTKVADIATLEESIRSGAVIPVDGAVVLYPGWTRDYYTLRFFDSDGSSEILPQIKVSKNVTTKEVKEVVDKTVNIVRDGYQVVWNRYRFDANGNRRIDDGGTRVPRQTVDQILKSTRNINRDFDFIAEWNAQPYTYEIEYLLDGGHFANADVSAGKVPKDFSIQSPDIVIPSPIRIGYHFAGWYLNSEHTIPVTGIASGTKGADSDAEGKVETYKLYATWVETSAAVPELLSMSYVSKGKISFSFGPADKAIRYEAAVSSSSDFSENVNVILFDKDGTYTVNNLLKKKYYVRVRSITRDSIGELIYSEWSQAKSAKVKSGVSEVKAQTGLIKLKKVNVQSGKLVIKAKAKKRLKSDDESYYLVKVNPLNGKYVKKTVTAASPKTSVVTFKLPLDDEDTAPGLLQGKYAIAIKKGGKYKLMTGAKYVKNPEAAATYTEAFPKAASKKGLQGEAAGEVGTKHVFNNYYVDEFMPSGADPVVTYVYNGKSYYFNQNMLKDITSWVSKANSKSQVATAQFMLKWPSANSKLVLSGGRSQGSAPNGLYAMSIQTKEAREYYEAFFSFLSGYLAKSDCHLDNWILGNEVNMYNDWYYAGSSSKSDIVANYAGVFRIMYTAARSRYKNARCYICMDHTFNDVGSSWGAKSFMASFDKLVNADGANVKWNLAFHAYPANLRRADTWNDTGINNSAAKTPYVTPKNLNVLTKYVKKTYGSDCRIILSEQGFTASSGTSIQAAAMAYTYYKAEFDNMIDAVIFRSDIDALEETKQGLYFGLLTAEHVKRQAYDVYKYMDTPRYAQYTAGLLSEIGVSSWGSVAKGFSESKLLSMPDIQ